MPSDAKFINSIVDYKLQKGTYFVQFSGASVVFSLLSLIRLCSFSQPLYPGKPKEITSKKVQQWYSYGSVNGMKIKGAVSEVLLMF